ncbi:MAG TPA: hypothetical protein VFX76_01005 [Roseiflexaceae bacterium]|nr:hypothetical protein [Roseiflexaceae bacterium]
MTLKYSRDALITLVLLALTYGYFYQDAFWNGNSRLGLTFAAVEEGRFTIDSYYAKPGVKTGDTSFFEGHYYTDKAIGSSLMAAIVYAPMYWLMQLSGYSLSLWLVKYLLTVIVIGLPSAFAGSLMYLVCISVGGSRLRAWVATIAIALGTMALPYGVMFYGHQLAAALLFCGFFVIYAIKAQPERASSVRLFLLGLLLGLALITEYTTAIVVLPLMVYYAVTLWQTRLWPRIGAFAWPILGGLIPIALLLAYNVVCYGAPLAIGYQYVENKQFSAGMSQGVMGIQWPRLDVLYYLTVHPAHGLFWQSPVLLMAVAGLLFMFRDSRYRLEAAVSAFALVVYLLVNSGYYMWWGGWAFGPRHLIPMLPFLCLPLMFVPRRWFPIVVALCVVSVFQMLVVTATVAQVPDEHVKQVDQLRFFEYTSIYSYCWNKLVEGKVTWTIGQSWLGLQGWTSFVPIVLLWLGGTSLFVEQRSPELEPLRELPAS